MNTKTLFFMQTLFAQQKADLSRYIGSKFSDSCEAEDLAQDAFYNMLQLEHPEELENPKAYLYQAATNLALNRTRKQGRQRRCEKVLKTELDNAQVSSPHAPDRLLDSKRELDRVLVVLQQLPEKVRTAFTLSRLENKNYTEIADAMGVSVSSVEKYLMTALKHLRSADYLDD